MPHIVRVKLPGTKRGHPRMIAASLTRPLDHFDITVEVVNGAMRVLAADGDHGQPTNDDAGTCGECNKSLSLRLLVALEQHPELLPLIEVWPTLPAALRAGILAMVKAANG